MLTPTHAFKINALMVKHGFRPIGIGENDWGGRLYEFVEWLSNMVGDREVEQKEP